MSVIFRVKVKEESRNWPGLAQRVPGSLAPKFHDIRHVKLVRSASRTGHLYPQECSWYSFSLGTESRVKVQ
jgi:hypothetical protein